MIVQDLVNNLAECIHKIKCKYENDDKKVKLAELNTNIATFFFKRWFNIIKMFMLQQEISKKFDEIIYKFSNHDINMFILLLQKGVYPYEYTEDCKKFNETSSPGKEDLYSHLNMEDLIGAD